MLRVLNKHTHRMQTQ